jgi:hypothetical protein
MQVHYAKPKLRIAFLIKVSYHYQLVYYTLPTEKYTCKTLDVFIRMLIHYLYCRLSLMLRAREPNFAEVARTT